MQADSEDVHVTKLVDLVSTIPKHLDLYVYDVSTKFYTFSKFTELSSFTSLHLGP